MNKNFNELSWHDANIKSILIDRSRPGEQDVIKFLIDWPDTDVNSFIEFYQCYAFSSNMNFGIVACESILQAECLINSEELDRIRKEWKEWSKGSVNLDELKCYRVITNSTNSIINVFSLGFRILDV